MAVHGTNQPKIRGNRGNSDNQAGNTNASGADVDTGAEAKRTSRTTTAYGGEAMTRQMPSGHRARVKRDKEKKSIFLGRAMHSTATSGISHATDQFLERMKLCVKNLNDGLDKNDVVKVAALGQNTAGTRFDVVTIARGYVQATGAVTHGIYIFVIAASRGELAPLSFDVGQGARVQLPNVCGDVPDDRLDVMGNIHKAVQSNALALFKVTPESCFIVGERVIERDNLLSTVEGDLEQYAQLLKEAVDTLDTYDSVFNENADQIDWSAVAVGESGRAVTNTVDFNPDDLFTPTGHPIHRQFAFRTSAYADDSDNSNNNRAPQDLQELGTMSGYFDVSISDFDKDDRNAEQPVFLSCIVTDWRSELGRNYLQLFFINLANLTQIRNDFQYLPAFDYRKREAHSDLSVLGIEVHDVFKLKEPGRLVINDPAALLETANRAISDSMEFAYDAGNCMGQSGLTQIIQDAASNPNGPGYWAIIDALDEVTNGKFSDLFFDGVGENETPPLFIYDNNLQLGGWRIDSTSPGTNKRRDFRDINHLAVVDANPHDPRIGAAYDDTIVPESDMPIAARLNSSMTLKEGVATRLVVTQYLRRYTFDPDMILSLVDAMDDAGFLAPIDGGRHTNDVRRRNPDDFRARGVPSTRRNKRRSGSRRAGY